MCILCIEAELPDQLRNPSYFCSMGRVNLVVVLKAAEFREDHIVLVVHCLSGCCYGSPNNLQKKPYPWKCFWLHWLYI